jgi:hypothetical protein
VLYYVAAWEGAPVTVKLSERLQCYPIIYNVGLTSIREGCHA